MRLLAWIKQEKLSFRSFGMRRQPNPVPRATVRQWALGLRFPQDPADLKWIEETTGGQVPPSEFVNHRLAVLSGAETSEAAAA